MKASLRRSDCLSEYDWEDDCYDYDKFYLISGENSRPKELFGQAQGHGNHETAETGNMNVCPEDIPRQRPLIGIEALRHLSG